MKKDEFRKYLLLSIQKKAASDCLSRCSTVEFGFKVDLDDEFNLDRGESFLSKISYGKREADAGLLPPSELTFKQGCNTVQRMTDLRSAVKRYFKFRAETTIEQ